MDKDTPAVPAAALTDANTELDSIASGDPSPAPNPDPTPTPDPAPNPDPAPAPKPEDKKPEPPKDEFDLNAGLPKKKEAPKDQPKDEFAGAKVPAQLRKAYEEQKQKTAALEAELAKLKGTPQAPKLDEIPEYKTAKQEAEELRKKYQETEERLKFADYSQSAEYRQQYVEPLNQAFEAAIKEVGALQIDGEERQATAADFQALLRMDVKTAAAKATELFGPAATEVMAHRRQILGLVDRQQKAVAEFKTKATEREQQQTKQYEENLKRYNGIFDDHVKERTAGDPELYSAPDGDAEAAEILDTGKRLVDLAFRPSAQIPPEKLAKVQAEVASRALGFGRALQVLEKTRAEVEQLKACLLYTSDAADDM
jgi:hypothetical protein